MHKISEFLGKNGWVIPKTLKIFNKSEFVMDKKPYQEWIEKQFDFLFERGFSYEYAYDKGSDSSCVYIYRFRKGRNFFDLRAVSGGGDGTFVVYVNGEYLFPSLKLRHKKLFSAFKRKHFFKKPTIEERFAFAALLLKTETETGNLFGLL